MHGLVVRAVPNLVVFLSGLAIMVLELVASRLVARHLGSSLEIWTAVISVILAGMSLGNYLGGRWTDLRNPLEMLPYLLAVSAVLCVSVLVTNDWIGGSSLLAALPRSLRVIVTITLVFFPPACALGTIQPTVARWAIEQSDRTGSAFGGVGAWATTGNILGTFLTGFILLSSYGVRMIVLGSVLVLILTGVGVYLWSRWRGVDAAEPRRVRPAQAAAGGDSEAVSSEVAGWDIVPNLLVFCSGMSIMMLELVGGRMLSRASGSSIYTWTSLIGVVLGGIALGNYIGGKLADRFNPTRTLPHLFLVASVLAGVLLTGDRLLTNPAIGSEVVNWVLPDPGEEGQSREEASRLAAWTMPASIFMSVLILFFAPTCALGTISPVVAKLAIERARRAGLALGNVYAWGTIGSIVGSFLTGFVLISWIGSKAVICLVAGLLALISVSMATSGLAHAIWAGVFLAVTIAVNVPESWERAARIGHYLELRHEVPEGEYHTESNYYFIKVQPSTEHPGAQELVLDNLVHGYVLEDEPRDLRYDYEQIYASIMERAGAIPAPEEPTDSATQGARPLRTFFIGGGSYTYPRYIEAAYPGSKMVVAEIDPEVTRTVHRALFLPESTPIVTRWGDARATIDQLLKEQTEPFDFVFGDAFNDFSVPWHLTTLEFNEKIKRLLTPNGVYMINIIDNFKYCRFLGAYIKTARQTFPSVAVFCTSSDGPTDNRETFVIAMAQQDLDYSNLGTRRGERAFHGSVLSDEDLETAVQRAGDMTLTDDFAPVENLLAPVARERDL